jgi:hypothetical protein
MSIEVTVRDAETGETETAVVDDYLLLVVDPCYLAHRQAHPNGTHILTVKNANRPPYQLNVAYAPT